MLIVLNDSLNRAQFVTAESEVASQADRVEPKLGGIVVSIDVHVRRFIWLMAVEVKPVRSTSQNSRHPYTPFYRRSPRSATTFSRRSPTMAVFRFLIVVR
jgi:hypothetical protein